MPRTPRVTQDSDATASLRDRVTSRKTLVTAGAGLGLAAVGTAAAAAVFTTSATTTSSADTINRAAGAVMARPHPVRTAADASRTAADAPRPAQAETWSAITRIIARQTNPSANGPLRAANQLTPAGFSGPQTRLPMTTARWDNATTIVRQAIAKHMGLRSAVIAVATAMQESTLVNVNYGTSDSLGLFQQRPSMGWGTAQQVMSPAYSADAFLNALHANQANNPGWARQPLWQSAQNVQGSALPYAYAKWEAQAAQVVQTVTNHMI